MKVNGYSSCSFPPKTQVICLKDQQFPPSKSGWAWKTEGVGRGVLPGSELSFPMSWGRLGKWAPTTKKRCALREVCARRVQHQRRMLGTHTGFGVEPFRSLKPDNNPVPLRRCRALQIHVSLHRRQALQIHVCTWLLRTRHYCQ